MYEKAKAIVFERPREVVLQAMIGRTRSQLQIHYDLKAAVMPDDLRGAIVPTTPEVIAS